MASAQPAQPEDQRLSPHPVGEDYPPQQGPGQRKYSVVFSPIAGTKEEYRDFFKAEGCTNFLDVSVHKNCGFVIFSAQADADVFVKHFDQAQFKDRHLTVKPASERQREPGNIRTLYISGIDPSRVSERDIFFLMAPYGFVRRINVKKEFAFIEFDSVDDARNAYRQVKGKSLRGSPFHIDFAHNEHVIDFSSFRLPLTSVLEPRSPFWYHLADMLSER